MLYLENLGPLHRGALTVCPPRLCRNELGFQCVRKPGCDLVLHLKQIGNGYQSARPKHGYCFCVDQLGIDAEATPRYRRFGT
jgi:hypothetical protein